MNDYFKHIIAGFAAAFVMLPCYLETQNLFAGLWVTIVAGIVAGAVKEFADMQHGGKWEWPEFIATIGGAVLVAVFIILMHFGKG